MHVSIAYAIAVVFGLSSVTVTWAIGDPCVEFASKVKQVYTGHDATLFRQCIQNVPFNAEKASETIKNIRKFLSMNTQSIYHINPPTPELELEPFNVNKTLDRIESDITKKMYKNNWSFDQDVVQLFQMFRDGHTVYEPVCTHGFMYIHQYPIVAVSSSAESLPDIYNLIHDFDSRPEEWKTPILGDKIKQINGKDVHDYLGEFIQKSPEELNWVDPDARFNDLFAVYRGASARGRFAHRNMWEGEELKLTWENGTEKTVEFTVSLSTAMVNSEGLMFKDTKTLTELCFSTSSKLDNAIEKREVVRRGEAVPNGYPTKFEDHSEEYAMISYSLRDDKETAVLALRTFTPGALDTKVFVDGQSKFLKKQIAAWKLNKYKRLIIDVTNNPGGKSILPYETFKQLFPSKDDHTTVNMRYSPTTWAYLLAISDGDENGNWHNPDGSDLSMAELLTPVEKDGAYFTNMLRPDYQEIGDELYDLDVESHTGSPLFSPSNIVIVSNSLCASACHSFVEMMHGLGVRAISYGGRANKTTPMQAVGGTKGGRVVEYKSVQGYINNLATNNTVNDMAGNSNTWLLSTLPVNMKSLKVNSENKFREKVNLPLQFVYTPACRRFYLTREMIEDTGNMWKYTRELAWDNDGKATSCTDYKPQPTKLMQSESESAIASGNDNNNESSDNGDEKSGTTNTKLTAYLYWSLGLFTITFFF